MPNSKRSSEHTKRRANELGGSAWTRNSISVWSDIRKSTEEVRWNHPAMFPTALVERVIESFTTSKDRCVLDPFMGSGSTLLGANKRNKMAIGLEISEDFITLAENRLKQATGSRRAPKHCIIRDDARNLTQHVQPECIDLCITSPPYWNILSQKRSADAKPIRDYGGTSDDLAKIENYDEFLNELTKVFAGVLEVMKPGSYCVVNVMDIRKKDRFFPFHSDLAKRLIDAGWGFDDLIVWDRRQEYNNLRPLGFPYVFRINKVHEFLLIFKKLSGSERVAEADAKVNGGDGSVFS